MTTAAPNPAPHAFGGRFIIGLGFVVLGMLFLLAQLGVGELGGPHHPHRSPSAPPPSDALPVAGGAHLRVTAVMGGVDIFVPRHWEVALHGTPLLGGIEDSRHPEVPQAGQPRPRLTIDATAVMGGIEIKDA